MFGLVRRWRESGTTARAFAQEHSVPPWTLYYWREQLVKHERPARRPPRGLRVRSGPNKTKLVPLRIVPEDTSGGLELILKTGDPVRISRERRGDTPPPTRERPPAILRFRPSP